eukprot:2149984-Prymnesium_polylepis.1
MRLARVSPTGQGIRVGLSRPMGHRPSSVPVVSIHFRNKFVRDERGGGVSYSGFVPRHVPIFHAKLKME